MRTINLGNNEGKCTILYADKNKNFDSFKEYTDLEDAMKKNYVNTRYHINVNRPNSSWKDLDKQSEQMIDRQRYCPAIRCLSLALDLMYSGEAVYRMDNLN